MNISGESFEIKLDESTNAVSFKGALRLSGVEDYAPILDVLKRTLASPINAIVIDLKELEFLNSSGITMLSRFVIEARDREGITICLIASNAVPWHARSLTNIQRLMPSLVVRLT